MHRRRFVQFSTAMSLLGPYAKAADLLRPGEASVSRELLFRHVKAEFSAQSIALNDSLYFLGTVSPAPLRDILADDPSVVPLTLSSPPSFNSIAIYTLPLTETGFSQAAKFLFSRQYAGTLKLRVKLPSNTWLTEIWAFGFNGKTSIGNSIRAKRVGGCNV